MYKELHDYYRAKGISALNFNCPYFSSCSGKFPAQFTTAKESFVSSGYVSHTIPRLVFISLDSGSAETDPALKTLESIRTWEEEKENIDSLPKNKHWYRTHELAFTILRNFQHGLKLQDARHYFAHINSAKCCENNPGRGQAHQILFDNCRHFVPGELNILDPDIIISQGKWGRLAMQGAFPVLRPPAYVPVELNEVKFVTINSHPVIWIETFHPRHTSFHTTNRVHYTLYEQVVRDFVSRDRSAFTIEQIEKDTPTPATHKEMEKREAKIVNSHKKKGKQMITKNAGLVTGYIELSEYPNFPPQKSPAKADCAGYQYISMKQLCNITEGHGKGRSSACNAFGGDKGAIPVTPERQARRIDGHRIKKFVLVSAVDKYLKEVGIAW
jgi:hypothetical protein